MPISPAQIARIRQLNDERDPECPWLFRTAEIRWEFEKLARDAIIPALDEIERLRAIEAAAIEWQTYADPNRVGEAGERLWNVLNAHEAPSPAEEGVTPWESERKGS